MDYFDDLGKEAVNAFNELDGSDSTYRDLPTNAPGAVSADIKSLIQFCKLNLSSKTLKRRPRNPAHYVFKLGGPLSTPAQLNATSCLLTQPRITDGEDDFGGAQFCQVASEEKEALQQWLTHRPSTTNGIYKPRQEQYPVTYFFYGTLADPRRLARLFNCLSTSHALALERAIVKDGALRTWGKKYFALVDHPGSEVEGWALKVQSEEEEDALRVYETARYEVVRAKIELKGGDREGEVLCGCTFRFAGWEDELDPL
ncbi:hypothetical protein BDV96DRAFT_640930 [Lophiotrema nucula]|uniref:Putative gamma-glutamylcyclotransferase n=1 Tax=Lophiotrema nucula TaxID=690887 RepID=A0A6A5ZTG0_9PLEO|nr:hypothetical protein BDV96DRAFT_640930 [Lophiotrema nucula]